jgi:hypothetical protein
MSKYLGDFTAGDVIDFKFTTFRPSTGAPFTLAGTPVVSVYKDNSVTQDTAGAVLTVDFDGVTGLHHVRVTANPTGGFYTNGGEFECVITTGTVDSVSVVGSCVGRFTLGATAANVYNALLASYTTADTFGARLVRSATSSTTNEVVINASNHIAANVHQMQNNVVTAASIATDAIDADALATDAVTEIVTAVWTRDPQVGFASGTSGYWLYEAGVNSQAIVSDTNTIAGTLYVESIADALLNRNVGGGSNSGRLVKEALYALRNKSEIVGATLSVYDALDALSWTAAVASSASADPVTGIDP